MGAFFTTLFAKIASVISWVGKLWVAIFAAAWDILRDALTWPVEQLFDLANSATSALDLSGLTQAAQSWGTLPGEVINILGLLGAGEAAAIIGAAIGIRLVLQLIPFVRLGS